MSSPLSQQVLQSQSAALTGRRLSFVPLPAALIQSFPAHLRRGDRAHHLSSEGAHDLPEGRDDARGVPQAAVLSQQICKTATHRGVKAPPAADPGSQQQFQCMDALPKSLTHQVDSDWGHPLFCQGVIHSFLFH